MLRLRDRLRLVAAALFLMMVLLPATARAEVMTPDGLDKVLGPIALYPDSVLGNVLVGATWPDQVVEANQWVKGHSGSQEPLSSALAGYDWDKSVKALAALPDVLGMMADDMAWTTTLGQAFVDQTDAVYDSIQRLRAKAQATGALQSSGDVVVQTDDAGYIMVGSSNPDVVYVPTYEPAVVYGYSPGAVVATTALVWGTRAVLNHAYYGACWDWRGHNMYMGAGYGTCGYYNGRVNGWGGNTVNVNNNVNINNVRNNINNSVRTGNTNVRTGNKAGQGRYSGANGYDRSGAGQSRSTAGQQRQSAGQSGRTQAPGTVSQQLPSTSQGAEWGSQSRGDSAAQKARAGVQSSGLNMGSGSQARMDSQRGAQSRASQARSSSPSGYSRSSGGGSYGGGSRSGGSYGGGRTGGGGRGGGRGGRR